MTTINTYGNYDSIPISIPITLDGQPVSLDPYAVNAPIDGSQGTPAFKVAVTIQNTVDNSIVTTEDGIICSKVIAFRSADSSVNNIAVLTLRKGFNFSDTTSLIATAWYDSTSGSSAGWRKCGTVRLSIDPNISAAGPPYS